MRALCAALAIASFLASAPCAAQRSDDDLARAHFESASAYFEQGRYEDAARAFIESYELSHRPELLDNAARSYERALLFDEAIQTLETLRGLQPERAQAIDDRIASIRTLQARVGSGQPAPPPESGGGTAAPASSGYVSMPGVALLVAGGVLGLAALFTGIGGHVIYEDLTANCVDRVCPAERQSDIDAGTGLVVTSTVLTFAAPIAAAIGVVLLVVDTGPRSSEHVRLTPGPGEIGLGVEARF